MQSPIDNTVYCSTWWAARFTGLSQAHVRRLCARGEIPGACRRFGTGAWLIPLTSLQRTLDSVLQEWLRSPLHADDRARLGY